ncbi:MAG: MBL fold metallo-hydrolase [bacterium]|nr:MBL fold metallo-hydrolase [bacterium]
MLDTNNIQVIPISHATMVIKWNGKVFYTDPVGGKDKFAGQPAADIILLTDIHSDHLDVETLQGVAGEATQLIAPPAVAGMLTAELSNKTIIMNNGEAIEEQGFKIEAVPMYNVPESNDAFHTKGRGNGYVVEAEGQRVYISGDTANTPELQSLQNIDLAFLAMNLPYTMSVEEAAEAVLAFKPKRVTPYHYRGPDGLSDIKKFKHLVNNRDANIKVELINFYP